MGNDLLPLSATPQERALSEAIARAAGVSCPIGSLWDPATCPAEALPWLAWALSVDSWDSSWSEAAKRAACARSIAIHRRKGTPWAVKEGLRAIGYAEASLSERLPSLSYDGQEIYSGANGYGDGAGWARFSVGLDLGEAMGVSREETAKLVRHVERWKPERSHLAAIVFSATVSDLVEMAEAETLAAHDGQAEVLPWGARYDGTMLHDSGRALVYDGTDSFDGTVSHALVLGGERRYDTAWDRAESVLHATASDTQAALALFDGQADYDGLLDLGATGEPVRDARMTVAARRHYVFNGHKSYGAPVYDGARAFDGSFNPAPWMSYAGVHTIEEIRI